jgi:hypothetical protein
LQTFVNGFLILNQNVFLSVSGKEIPHHLCCGLTQARPGANLKNNFFSVADGGNK